MAKKVVSKLALEWEDTLTFVFNEDCTIKRLKICRYCTGKNDDILKEDFAQRFDADFLY